MSLESGLKSIQPSFESTALKPANGDNTFSQQASVESWTAVPLVGDKTGIQSGNTLLPRAAVDDHEIVFSSGANRQTAIIMAANETKLGEPKPGAVQIRQPFPRPYRINGDGTVEFGSGPAQGPGTWQNPNNK